MENELINFKDAMYLVEHQETQETELENYLGFTAPESDDAVIQFIRETQDKWIIDIPVMRNDKFTGSYVSSAEHSKVVAIVTNFFIKESILRKTLVNQRYEEFQLECGSRWGLGFHFVEPS